MTIFDRIKKLNLPLGQYAVFGGALLDVWGFRQANDLDIIVTPELYKKLKRESGWREEIHDGFTLLLKDDASVATVQPPRLAGHYNPDRIKLINEAVLINDVPFVRVEEVIACKTDYNRPKDLKDLANIRKYLATHRKEDIYKFG